MSDKKRAKGEAIYPYYLKMVNLDMKLMLLTALIKEPVNKIRTEKKVF